MFPSSRAIKSATLGCTSTTNACEVDDSASPTRRRSMFTAAVCGESTTPAPLHVGQGTVIVPRNPSVTFWRVISTKPRGCLLYTSDAADDLLCVDLGGRRIIKQKQHKLKFLACN